MASILEPSAPGLERTLAMIKPDACGQPWIEQFVAKATPPEGEEETEESKVDKWDAAPEIRAPNKAVEIISRIEKAGFKVVQQRLVHLSKTEAETFYAEHNGKPFFDKLTGFMSSGATLALVLEKQNAIKDWRALMGPTNTIKAKEQAELQHPLNEELWSLRALFGTDGTKNATHGSDSAQSAEREIRFFFPELSNFERAAVVVLPHAVEAGAADAIVTELEDNDFFILGRKNTALTAQHAHLLTKDAEVAAALVAGVAEVIIVEREAARSRLRALCGPSPLHSSPPLSSPALSSPLLPSPLLRSKFGKDSAHIGITFAENSEDTVQLTEAAFPSGLPLQKTLCVMKPGVASLYYDAIVHDILAAGFTVLAETRRCLAREEVEDFYAEHKGKPFFDGLCNLMTSGAVVALALAKPNAIRCWRQLIGPTDVVVARREKPASLRAKFGTLSNNALHGSDSVQSATREIRFYFPHLLSDQALSGAAAVQYLKSTVITHVFDSARSAIVPKTLDSVLVDALAAFAKNKPSASPAEAIKWLGHWLIDNNPKHGVVASESYKISEPDDEDARESVQVRGMKGGAGMLASAAAQARASISAYPTRSVAPKRTIVFVLGGPGSGKGTQCERIAKQFGYVHLSTGDIMRAEAASGSELGKQLAATMSTGGLVSDDIAMKLLQQAMDKAPSQKFLIDGYPRSLNQALAFEKQIGAPTAVIAFEASEAVLEARLLNRGKSSGRADDADITAIRARFKTFVEQSAPVIDFYSRLGLVKLINTEKSVDEVHAVAVPHFRPQLVWVMGAPAAGKTSVASGTGDYDLGFHHICVPELIQAEISSGSAFGREIGAIVGRGDVIDTPFFMRLLQEEIERRGPIGRYLLDGAPRNLDDAKAITDVYGQPYLILNLSIPDEVAVRRFVSRRSPTSVKLAHAAKLAARKHLEHFKKQVQPIIGAYSKRALVRTIDASLNKGTVIAAALRALQPEIVFVLGGPGVGKGTQCAKIASTFGYTHLSAGDLLRSEVARSSANGEMISNILKEGRLVPMEVTIDLLRRAMIASRSNKLLIDGFPRDVPQAAAFEVQVGKPAFVLFFDADESVLRARLQARAATSGRVDDNDETILKRFHTFKVQESPVINRYAPGGLVHTIDSAGTPDDVFAKVSQSFRREIVIALGLPGSGKRTQCEYLVRELGFTHVCVDDLLRSEVDVDSPVGDEIKRITMEGGRVGDDVIMHLISSAVSNVRGKRVVIDGLPLSAEQAEQFDREIGAPTVVLHFSCPNDLAKQRLLKRGKASGRSEDSNEAAVVKRLNTYEEQVAPLLSRYAALKVVRTIDAVPPIDIVFGTVRPLFQPQIAIVVGTAGSGQDELAARAGNKLGYCTLKITSLLQAEIASGSDAGLAIAEAFAAKRTAPVDLTLALIQDAMQKSGASKFLLEGFPRTVSLGFPGVHDQVFALEAKLGQIKGCICLDCDVDVRLARAGAKTPGEVALIKEKVQTFQREKLPVVAFFHKIGKAIDIDTSKISPDAVYEAARPFLE